MLIKVVLASLMIAILVALGMGLYYLYKDPAQKQRTLRSLMVRVGLALFLIALLTISVSMGWIHPHAVGQ